jgi:hypothetical protein
LEEILARRTMAERKQWVVTLCYISELVLLGNMHYVKEISILPVHYRDRCRDNAGPGTPVRSPVFITRIVEFHLKPWTF